MNDFKMPFGQHKGWKLRDIPNIYLSRLYMSNMEMVEKFPQLKQFIETECAALLSVKKPINPVLCDTFKICFIDKEAADKELKRIRKITQKHDKPVRSYKCERCGFYHHTKRP